MVCCSHQPTQQKSSYITGIAGCTVTTQFRYRIRQTNSIYTAETLTVGTTLDDLGPWNPPLILITDSLSVVKMLQTISIKSRRIICDFLISFKEQFYLHRRFESVGYRNIKIFTLMNELIGLLKKWPILMLC